MNRSCLVFALIGLLFGSMQSAASAVDIEEVIWGFDGKAVPFRMNPVSVLVSNNSEESVAVQLRFSRMNGNDRAGAKVEEPVFLSPYSSRWVQFYTLVHRWDEFRLSWGLLPSQQYDLDSPSIGGPARVALIAADVLRSNRASTKTLSDELFPPVVSATENLEALYLDYVPRWQDARRQALLDWIQRGGMLFLSPGADGGLPTFTSQLAVLNSPLPEQQVGQGIVFRCDSREAAVELATLLLGEPKQPTTEGSTPEEWDLHQRLLGPLRSMTTPEHNWLVIHLLSLIYVGLVFPGWYLLSRRPTDYRTTILAFVGVALLLTLVFNMVGRRGYGEATTVNSVALARSVSDDAYDVLLWSNVFVTESAKYKLVHRGSGDLYSTGTTFESINGTIDNGLEGSFAVDIPLYSSMSYIHRGKADGPKVDFAVQEFQGMKTLETLKLESSDPLPQCDTMFLLYGSQFYAVANDGDKSLRVVGSTRRVNSMDYFAHVNQWQSGRYNNNYKIQTHLLYDSLMDPLITRDLGIHRPEDLDDFVLPRDRVRLYMFGDIPRTFGLQDDALGKYDGKVLYVFQILLPDGGGIEYVEEEQEDDEEDEQDDDGAVDEEEEEEETME